MNSFEEMWQQIVEKLKFSVSSVAFNVWLSPLKFLAFENDVIILEMVAWKIPTVRDKYTDLIVQAAEDTIGFHVDVKFVADTESKEEDNKDHGYVVTKTHVEYNYTFDNFIIGPSNRFAHAAALNVANNPGKVYNPLFIYGHSGLGKTHLLSAIKNEIQMEYPNFNIIYTSGEHFTNELINCLRTKTNYAFHEKYRNCDVLLVDDIQFIADKESTQEEFFHTFVALRDAGKQIVLTSDRPPKEMLTLQERLLTRFESGLIADITPPSLETRMAIVKRKADDLDIVLTDDVITFLADNIKRNVRQLEGAVKKIKAFRDVEGAKLNVATAKRAIADIINDKQPLPMTIENVINEVSRTFNVNPQDIRSNKRNANISHARQVAIYIINQITDLSLIAIGKEFGNKHYATVIYAIDVIKDKMENDISLKTTIDDIIKNIDEY